MSHLPDHLPLSSLTIPGTHDSAAFTYSWPFIQTQSMNFLEQLAAGIRYFDLRCGLRDDSVQMVHGTAVLGITLTTVLSEMYLWLSKHQSECLVVQIKQDRHADNSTMHFSTAICHVLAQASPMWRTANTTPTLGSLRGKIQLFRRFNFAETEPPSQIAYGIDGTRWEDNPNRPFTILTSHYVRLTIQDHYSFADPLPLPSLIAKKGGDVAELLQRATEDSELQHWYVNFTSAFEFSFWFQVSPKEVAKGGWWAFKTEVGVNERLKEWLRLRAGEGRRRLGIVVMDFPESGGEGLVEALIGTNFGKQRKVWRGWEVFGTVMLVLLMIVIVVLTLWAPCGASGVCIPQP